MSIKQVVENYKDLKRILPDCERVKVRYYLSYNSAELIVNSRTKKVVFSRSAFQKTKKKAINFLESNGVNIIIKNHKAGRRPKYLFQTNNLLGEKDGESSI